MLRGAILYETPCKEIVIEKPVGKSSAAFLVGIERVKIDEHSTQKGKKEFLLTSRLPSFHFMVHLQNNFNEKLPF